MRSRTIFSTAVLFLFACAILLSGCSFDRWVEFNGGDYIPVAAGVHQDSPAKLVKSMTVAREGSTLKLILKDGSIINESFTARSKQDWPSGCPANLGSTRMEVLDLNISELTIGSVVLSNPVLVRDCPGNPERVILREDGLMGGSGTACAGNDKCIHLKPGTPSEPMQNPRELTWDEKNLVIDIAVSSPEMEIFLEQGSAFRTEPKWIARLTEESGAVVSWQIDYQWQSDDKFNGVPEAAIWLPAVLIKFAEPEQRPILVAVDLDTERVVYTQGNKPLQPGIPSPAEDRLPNITGWITDVQPASSSLSGRVLVEMDESDGTSDKYWVGIKQDTLINDYRRGTQEILAFSDLETGLQVQVWFGSPVRESYPAQVDAAQIDTTLNEEFAIYLLDESILPHEMPVLSHVELPETPIVSIKDIISYSRMTHAIELTPEAYARIQNLEVPRVFVVTVARRPIYWGSFWIQTMSSSFDGVVILKPLSQDQQVIQLDLGYPSGMCFTGDDPRPNPVVMKSLERAGKLSAVIGQHLPIEEIEKVD